MLDDAPLAAATAAGLADRQESLREPHLTRPAAVLADRRLRAGLGPAAPAGRTGLQPGDDDLFLDAGGRLLEADLQVIPQVRPAVGAPPGAAGPPPEKPLEDVVEDAAEARVEVAEALAAATGAGGPEAVVGFALLGVAQDRIRFTDRLEAVLRRRIAGILVRVMEMRELPVRLLDLVGGGFGRDPQDLIVIPLLTHAPAPSFSAPLPVADAERDTLTMAARSTRPSRRYPFWTSSTTRFSGPSAVSTCAMAWCRPGSKG